MRAPLLFAAVFLCLAAAVAHGQATQDDYDAREKAMEAQEKAEVAKVEKATHIPDPAAGDRWQDIARAHHWDKSAIDAIARDKILFGGREYRQIFSPYAEPEYPQFITSDSVLNAYHVLFEETIRQIESANSGRITALLQKIWKGLPAADAEAAGNADTIASAYRRAQITIAVALALNTGESPKFDLAIAPVVAAEVKKVSEATAMEKAAWLGPPSADLLAIDYSRFTIRGFYNQSPALRRYFQAVAWLQAIPFRVNDDTELLSAVMIARAASKGGSEQIDGMFNMYDKLLGDPDDPDLQDVAQAIAHKDKFDLTTGGWRDIRAHFVSVPQINDQVRLQGKASITIRILPSRRTPDALLFERIMQQSKRPLPSGLDIAAALGSPYAAKLIGPPAIPHGPLFDPANVGWGTLYADYLHCLQALLTPDKDAPKVFTSPLWQAKTCQTMVSGWAQLRHTWQLQAKENITSFGVIFAPPGFVEPVPGFYTRMAALGDRCDEMVRLAHIDGPDFSLWSGRAHALIDLIEKTDVGRDGKPTPHILTDQERADCMDMLFLLSDDAYNDAQIHDQRSQLPTLEKWAAAFDQGKLPDDARVANALGADTGPDLRDRWHLLSSICLHLDAMVQKQLRGADFNEDETNYIRNYGALLARVMLYDSDSFELARDDAPRIADVYRNPNVNQYLEVGVGRPRSFYILYPYHGGEVLCEGAVMPYYEFPHGAPMTDAAWMDMLNSKSPPKPMFPMTQP